MAPVAAALVARGHDVHWAANETVGFVRSSGAKLHAVLPDDVTEDAQAFAGTSAAEIDDWFLGSWFVPIAEQALAPTISLITAVRPDLLVCDATALWGAMVADATGVPWATYCPGLFMSSHERQVAIRETQAAHEPMRWGASVTAAESSYWDLERRLNALRHRFGLAASMNLNRVSDSLVLCFTTRAIELDRAGLPDQARCVGPVFTSPYDVDPFPGEEPILPPGEEPLVFLTFGRVYARLG
ncbi:MAG: hypothetical protein ACRDGH_13680, partial [Candidatus Limnocylindria bacterium]